MKSYSAIFAFVLAALLPACDSSKSCDEWANEMEAKCCAGKAGCSISNKAAVVTACNQVDAQCSGTVECSTSGTSSSSCPIMCACK
jgi:hypothetical protein